MKDKKFDEIYSKYNLSSHSWKVDSIIINENRSFGWIESPEYPNVIRRKSTNAESSYRKTRLYNGKFSIPWGSKLYVGIEDVSVFRITDSILDASRHNQHLDRKMSNENREKSHSLKAIMKISCENLVTKNRITLE